MTTVQPPLQPTPQPSQASAPVEGEVVDVQITKLPENLASTDRAITLKGEVAAQNPDGTVRIATPRGPIDVKLPDGQTVQRGQTVEVQIPAGSPPRNAAVTLPQTPTPQPLPQQTPLPNIPQSQQGAPLAQQQAPVHSPYPQGSQPLPPAVEIASSLPQAVGKPAPQQGAAQQQNAQGTSSSAPATANESANVSPKGLLDFLKTTLQSALKTAPDAEGTQKPVQVFTQRPLALGQLARLTPLLSGQQVTQQQTAVPAATLFAKVAGTIATPTAAHASLSSLTSGPLQTAPQQTPLQGVLQSVLGNTVNLGLPASAQADPIARLLLPLLATINANGTTAAQSQPQNIGISAPALSGLIAKGETLNLTPLPHQQTVTVQAQPHGANALPATDVRVMAQLPTAPHAVLQSPQTATLLHGTPTSPVIFATVKGQTPQGLPVIELPTVTTLPDGSQKQTPTMMVLQFPARGLSPATILRLDVLPNAQPVLAGAPYTAGTPVNALPWESLDDALRILHAEPQAKNAIPLLQAALPKPGGAAFTAPVLMFVAALRSGDVTNWIGEKTADILKVARRGEALTRIGSDFATQSRENADAPRGEWKSLTLPFLYGQEVNRIALHTRAFEREDELNPSKRKSGTRFVMDLNLTRMGDLQIDGFSLDKKLDVTLRTEKPLSPAMRENVRARYANALFGIGFSGNLNFNASPERKGWVGFDAPASQREASA